MTTMWDSVTGSACPLNAQIVAGYIDGSYGPGDKFGTGWSAAAWAEYPNAQHVTITTRGTPGARVADCEDGAMTVPQTVTWARNEIAAGRRPTIYADAWDWANVIDQALATVGLRRVANLDGWVAHKGAPAVVPNGFVAIQYAQSVPGGRGYNVDISVTNGVWPGMSPPPAPNPPEEDMIASTPSGNGYWVVLPNGSVYSYGDANYYGGCNPGASSPMPAGHIATGFAVHPSGKGYWISTDFAGVYSFGQAVYHGAPNATAIGVTDGGTSAETDTPKPKGKRFSRKN